MWIVLTLLGCLYHHTALAVLWRICEQRRIPCIAVKTAARGTRLRDVASSKVLI